VIPLWATAAHAYGDRTDAITTPDGVTVTIGRSETVPGRAGVGGGGGSACTAVLFTMNGEPRGVLAAPSPSPEHQLYLVTCPGPPIVRSAQWFLPAEVAAATVDPRAIAEELVRQIPVGQVQVAVRPVTHGVTGIPSLFWVEGYDGIPLERSVSELGVNVDVRVSLAAATWDFGDGLAAGAGLGDAWPARSSVAHDYQVRSPAGSPHAVVVDLELAAEFRVDGGAWQALDPITRTSTLPYEVQEIQAVRNR